MNNKVLYKLPRCSLSVIAGVVQVEGEEHQREEVVGALDSTDLQGAKVEHSLIAVPFPCFCSEPYFSVSPPSSTSLLFPGVMLANCDCYPPPSV